MKPHRIGMLIYFCFRGSHPELGRDFYGTIEEQALALYFLNKYEPIEDEL